MTGPSIIERVALGLKAFREAYVSHDLINALDFENFEARKVRYDILGSFYDNSTYRDLIHSWGKQYRSTYQLYKAIRNIYNPTNRCVEFWKWMIWGGILDPEAKEAGAIPIKTDKQAIRPAIAKLWKDSNWAANKDVATMFGTEFGDVGIKIVDDPGKGQVRLEVVHPKTIKDLTLDTSGYVKGYVLQDVREWQGKLVTFQEECWHNEGEDEVHFATYKDNQLFAWNGVLAEWVEFYGFVPFVAIQHIRTGMNYGWAEIHPFRVKVQELDDLASKMHDYIRKVVDPVWLFNFKQPKGGIDLRSAQAPASVSNPQPIREELPAIYVGDTNAKGQALVTSEIDIQKAVTEVQNVIAELERDLPELQMDIWTAGQYTTGKALRNARQRVERKVIQRRPEYDAALVRAHQMALSVGGSGGYKGYEGFSLNSYADGDLDHVIPSERRIFDTDQTEELDKKKIFWDVIVAADRQGLPLEQILLDLGKSQDWVTKFLADKKKQDEENKKNQPVVPGGNANTTNPDGTPVAPGDQVAEGAVGNSQGGTPANGATK